MAKQRMINTEFWVDNYTSNLDPIEKLLFLYLLTNDKTNICGVYQLPIKLMAVETGIEKEMVEKLLKRFERDGKIMCFEGWVALKNFIKNQNQNSPQVKKGIEREIANIPDKLKEFIGYGYPIDTLSHLTKPNLTKPNLTKYNNNTSVSVETDSPPPKKNIKLKLDNQINKIYNYRNEKNITTHQKITKDINKRVGVRLNEYTEDQLKTAIDNYAIIYHSTRTFWKYKWTLAEFMQRQNGMPVFLYKSEQDYLIKDGFQKKPPGNAMTQSYDYDNIDKQAEELGIKVTKM